MIGVLYAKRFVGICLAEDSLVASISAERSFCVLCTEVPKYTVFMYIHLRDIAARTNPISSTARKI